MKPSALKQNFLQEFTGKIPGTRDFRVWAIAVGVVLLTLVFITVIAMRLDRYANEFSNVAGPGALDMLNFADGDPVLSISPLSMSVMHADPTENGAALHALPFDESRVPVDSNLRGNGVRVGNAFKILTSQHVGRACPHLIVIGSDGLPHHATLVAEDDNNDLAMVEARTLPASNGISIRGFPALAFNETVWHVRPSAFRGDFQEEAIVGIARVADLARRDDSRLVTLISDQRGNGPAFIGGDSGGPVTDADGRLVGIIAGTLPSSRAHETEFAQNIGFMVNVGLIELFLHANRVDDYRRDHAEPDDPLLRPRDILEYVVGVHCDRQFRSESVGHAATIPTPTPAGK